MTEVDELLGIEYGSHTKINNGVNFTIVGGDQEHGMQGMVGNRFESAIYSGVKSKKINKSLFSINRLKDFKGFLEVEVYPTLKMGGAKYKHGFLFNTDTGRTLFLPTKTKHQLQAKLEKRRFGQSVKNSHRQIMNTEDEWKDSIIAAMPPGKRISKNGNTYYENRSNRSDLKNSSWDNL